MAHFFYIQETPLGFESWGASEIAIALTCFPPNFLRHIADLIRDLPYMEPSRRHLVFGGGNGWTGHGWNFRIGWIYAEWQLDRMFYATRWVNIVRARRQEYHWFDIGDFCQFPSWFQPMVLQFEVIMKRWGLHTKKHVLTGQYQDNQELFFWTTGIECLQWRCYFLSPRSSIWKNKMGSWKVQNPHA